MKPKRYVFFLSDGTGITTETLGLSLLTQFPQIEFITETIPYVNSKEKAQEVVEQVNQAAKSSGAQPIIFATFANPDIRNQIAGCKGLLLDFLQTFIGILEQTLGTQSSHGVGLSHGVVDYEKYKLRIEAVNFCLATDDGANVHRYEEADLILVGVSRCGKTPTSLYLALQYGIFVANYPITEDDLIHNQLPISLQDYKHKLFGLTIDLERLILVRHERRPASRYASYEQCNKELQAVEKLFMREKIGYLNSTHLSVEELSTRILAFMRIHRRLR